MIANTTKQMMSIEILALDSALSPAEQSFFTDDCQTQRYSDIKPQTPLLASDDYWIQDFEDIRSYYESVDFDLNNEPELSLEAMTKGVDIQSQSKAQNIFDYLDSSAFLSPVSIGPASPPQPTDINVFEQELADLSSADISLEDKWENTTGMAILEEILSANSSDSEVSSEQCFDSDLNVQYITETELEAAEEPEPIGRLVSVETKERPKRKQLKRKVSETEASVPKPKPKANKRPKTTVTEKRERKRSQNKSAANRYRIKKRAEIESIEDQEKRHSDDNSALKAQLQKLQMEFQVVYPLAKAAFAADAAKAIQLQMLDLRVLTDSLLE